MGLLSLLPPLSGGHAAPASPEGYVLRRIDLDQKAVALTVDEDFTHAVPVLGTLSKAGAHATFFAYARDALRHIDTSRAILEGGSEIASMGEKPVDWKRASAPEAERQLARSDRALEPILGENGVNFFRPASAFRPFLPGLVRSRGQLFALWKWDLDALSDQALTSLGNRVRPGDILRIKDGRDTAPRLEKALASLEGAGFRVESLRDLVLDSPRHLTSCGVNAPSPEGGAARDAALARLLHKRGGTLDRLARALYGIKPGVRLEGRGADRRLPWEARALVHTFALQMSRPPVNVDVMPDGRVVDGLPGVRIDEGKTFSDLMRARKGENVRATRVPVPPEWTKEDVARLTSELGRFHTWIYGSEGRVHNILHGAFLLNNLLLVPNKPFSFFAALGPAQDETGGWRRAPIYIYGGSMQAYGGGLCQVSTTLYQAARRSGMEILERHPHGRPVPYVAKGMDATVAYPHFNLRFVNRRKTPVLLRMEVRGGRLDAWLLGDPKDGPARAAGKSSRILMADLRAVGYPATRSMSAPRLASLDSRLR